MEVRLDRMKSKLMLNQPKPNRTYFTLSCFFAKMLLYLIGKLLPRTYHRGIQSMRFFQGKIVEVKLF